MRTWLVIVRGDPLDPVPIGICRDRGITLAAIRGAWREWRDVAREHASDPVLQEGVEGMAARLKAAAAELEDEGQPARVEEQP